MPDKTRTRILQAAGPIFAKKGFEASTVREICDSADVNVASVNYHFGDKKRLYLETVKHARDLRVEQVPWPEVPEHASTHDKLCGFVETMLTRVLGINAEQWPSQLMMREMLDPTEDCRSMVEDFFRPRLNRLQDILDPAFPSGFEEHRRQQFAFSVMGQCLFYRVAGGVFDIVVPKKQRNAYFRIEQLAAHITNVTLAALGDTELLLETQPVSHSGKAS
jgi:AcrR family transcriptional regulator